MSTDNSNQLACPQCRKTIPVDYFLQHLQEMHGEEILYECNTCFAIGKTSFALLAHLEKSHQCQSNKPEENQMLIITCIICKKRFQNKRQVMSHILSTHRKSVKNYVCQVCKFRSMSLVRLRRHVRAAHKAFWCDKCLKILKTQGERFRHERLYH